MFEKSLNMASLNIVRVPMLINADAVVLVATTPQENVLKVSSLLNLLHNTRRADFGEFLRAEQECQC